MAGVGPSEYGEGWLARCELQLLLKGEGIRTRDEWQRQIAEGVDCNNHLMRSVGDKEMVLSELDQHYSRCCTRMERPCLLMGHRLIQGTL